MFEIIEKYIIKSDIFSSKDYFDHILEQTYLED